MNLTSNQEDSDHPCRPTILCNRVQEAPHSYYFMKDCFVSATTNYLQFHNTQLEAPGLEHYFIPNWLRSYCRTITGKSSCNCECYYSITFCLGLIMFVNINNIEIVDVSLIWLQCLYHNLMPVTLNTASASLSWLTTVSGMSRINDGRSLRYMLSSDNSLDFEYNPQARIDQPAIFSFLVASSLKISY